MPNDTLDHTAAWTLIHRERAAAADTLAGLTDAEWAAPSLCQGWSVHVAAAHILAGAEQTGPNFMKEMALHGFRFNVMIDRVARRLGQLSPEEIISRLRARTATTNHPPAPILTMLGEVVVHSADIRGALGIPSQVAPAAAVACLTMYTKAGFPLGSKKRIQGLQLVATDVDWTYGSGPKVAGPAQSVLLAMTGRGAGLDGLEGDGVALLRGRLAAA
jgi:uncharacterized protein (TIGR03083 family)